MNGFVIDKDDSIKGFMQYQHSPVIFFPMPLSGLGSRKSIDDLSGTCFASFITK